MDFVCEIMMAENARLVLTTGISVGRYLVELDPRDRRRPVSCWTEWGKLRHNDRRADR